MFRDGSLNGCQDIPRGPGPILPLCHNLHALGRGPLGDSTYQMPNSLSKDLDKAISMFSLWKPMLNM